ncbi:hypothetical protein EV356DRAFT_496891 [Viridothelium virens]|uniref:Uncharacterized protein n=1 Tax=Viridothelium virens TaxID=1048519 RepID=A0A6A6HGP8_VIRVR|nr:hypothetical protein EV356DRAFT_496891 [Viridothelium virens]
MQSNCWRWNRGSELRAWKSCDLLAASSASRKLPKASVDASPGTAAVGTRVPRTKGSVSCVTYLSKSSTPKSTLRLYYSMGSSFL